MLNVHAVGGKAYIRSGRRTDVRLEEVPAEQRAPGARPHVQAEKAAPLAEFEALATSCSIFRIAPASPA